MNELSTRAQKLALHHRLREAAAFPHQSTGPGAVYPSHMLTSTTAETQQSLLTPDYYLYSYISLISCTSTRPSVNLRQDTVSCNTTQCENNTQMYGLNRSNSTGFTQEEKVKLAAGFFQLQHREDRKKMRGCLQIPLNESTGQTRGAQAR